MSDFFNEYGCVPIDGPIQTLADKIEAETTVLMKKMLENGATTVEVRAASEYLQGMLSVSASFVILQHNARLRKAEREATKKANPNG